MSDISGWYSGIKGSLKSNRPKKDIIRKFLHHSLSICGIDWIKLASTVSIAVTQLSQTADKPLLSARNLVRLQL